MCVLLLWIKLRSYLCDARLKLDFYSFLLCCIEELTDSSEIRCVVAVKFVLKVVDMSSCSNLFRKI